MNISNEESAIKDMRGGIEGTRVLLRRLIPEYETEIQDLDEIIEGIEDERELEKLYNGLSAKEGDKIFVNDISLDIPFTITKNGRLTAYLIIETDGYICWDQWNIWAERQLREVKIDHENLEFCNDCGEIKLRDGQYIEGCICKELKE
ncbi:MAG: hypothetical protein AMQ74_01826 [Candidatus Methanofastidiosum methylothiophilum]|uniref:Uncharacterized protein n=1 Tax=Candidatus Methanofastidiosum methylothiophilum TaxID=1705564 RepID=A0A150IND1_9EURY|nr:MAG: hypothetical protein AMQ74_01826 [Candidatus Methanofastidiosum methylthiophilus]